MKLPSAPARPSARAIKAITPYAATSTHMYLHATGITGEVPTPGYVGQIGVFSVSWGVSNPDPATVSGAKAELSDLSLQIDYDRSEPLLETYAEAGKTIPTATLTEVASDGTKIRTWVLTNARVDSLAIGAATGSGASVSLALSYEQRKISYYYQDSSGTTHSVTSCWNVPMQTTQCTG